MTASEAYKLFAEKHDVSKMRVRGGMEYASCFVFEAVPLELKNEDVVYDCLYAVDKKTGEQKIFMPMSIPFDEYEAGRKLKPYEYLL